jgi:hypothetical protein
MERPRQRPPRPRTCCAGIARRHVAVVVGFRCCFAHVLLLQDNLVAGNCCTAPRDLTCMPNDEALVTSLTDQKQAPPSREKANTSVLSTKGSTSSRMQSLMGPRPSDNQLGRRGSRFRPNSHIGPGYESVGPTEVGLMTCIWKVE